MELNKRLCLKGFGLAGLAVVCPLMAQPVAVKPVTVIVPFAPGGAIDGVARQLAAPVAQLLGQAWVVDNVTGAFGTIGTQKAAHAAADGQTLLFAVSSPLNVAPVLTPSAVRYDSFRDFLPLTAVGQMPFAVVGRQGLPADTLEGLIRWARAHPGVLNFGTDGRGSLLHITGELIRLRTGLDWVHVPYKAAPQAVTDVLGGQLDLAILPVALVQQHVQEGRMKALAVSAAQRLGVLPQVPTLSELPAMKGVALSSWLGLLAPAGLRQSEVDRLNQAVGKVAGSEAFRQMLQARGIVPQLIQGAEFERLMRSERALIADVVRQSGMSAE